MADFNFSMAQRRQDQLQQEQTFPSELDQDERWLAVEQLNQHVLLTVQSINQLQAVFTVRGA